MKAPESWDPEAFPYMASAMAYRQWPQARVAAARKTSWSNDGTCRLCKAHLGTLLHRFSCPFITQQRVHHKQPESLPAASATFSVHQKEAWQTRGLGAVRIFTPQPAVEGSLVWIKPFPDDVPFHSTTWFTDASMIDADIPAGARFGATAIAVNDTSGELLAAAFGNPPARVSSIAAAEAWALTIATSTTPCRERLVTDCQSLLKIANRGHKIIQDSRLKNARVWAQIMSSQDSNEEHSRPWLEWVPAHRSRADVNRLLKPDGSKLTELEWWCNHTVVLLAKAAANKARLPAATRQKILSHQAAAMHWRATLGSTTMASQRFQVTETHPDGSVSTRLIRDSDGKPPPPTKDSC